MNEWKEFKERYDVANQLYALLFPVLTNYETRGYNAHSRAQTITMEVIDKMGDWIRRQKTSPVSE